MRPKNFAVKFNDRGICRTSRISKSELLMTIFKKLLTSFTKNSTSDFTDVPDKPLLVRSLQNLKC